MAKEPRTLFLGNGIHQLSNGESTWRKLVEDLAKKADATSVLERLDDKPFTLVYEEIRAAYMKKRRDKGDKKHPEWQLKKLVADVVGRLNSNKYLQEIVKLDYDHFVTTNYDYAIEHALGGDKGTIAGRKKEAVYSAYRFRNAGGKKVWHIHGEVEHPSSICLGNDHYVNYLHKLQDITRISNADHSPNGRGGLSKYVDAFRKNGVIDSWLQLFTAGSVDIVGFGMEYTEIDIWWLICQRAREIAANDNQLPMLGNINYYHFNKKTHHGANDKRKNEINLGRLDILRSLDVNVKTINFNTQHHEAYETWFANMKNGIHG